MFDLFSRGERHFEKMKDITLRTIVLGSFESDLKMFKSKFQLNTEQKTLTYKTNLTYEMVFLKNNNYLCFFYLSEFFYVIETSN